MLPSLLLLPLLTLLAPQASASDSRLSTHSLPLYHRVLSLSSPLPPWSRRGVIHLDSHTSDAWLDENGDPPSSLGMGERYQLGLGRHMDTELEALNIVIVDSCVLLHAPQTAFEETFILAYTRAPEEELIHFRYLTNTLEGCEKDAKGPLERGGGVVEVEVDRGTEAEPVRYRDPKPVELGKDGKVVVPPKEKSMVEKYWIYALPILIIAAMSGGPEEGAPAAE